MTHPQTLKIAIVGAGVSGLSAATELIELQDAARHRKFEITVFESRSEVGGLLQTYSVGPRLIESSADMFTTKLPYALQLCQRIGYLDQLIATNPENRGARLATNDGLQPIPQGFSLLVPKQIIPVLRSRILSSKAKLRMLLEPVFLLFNRRFRSGDNSEDESLESFAVRHWGREIFEKVIQPLVAGIYTADPAQLSMKAALAEFVELEQKHGRLLKVKDDASITASTKSGEADGDFQDALSSGGSDRSTTVPSSAASPATGARYGLFLGPKHGMQHWMERVQRWLSQRDVKFEMSCTLASIQNQKPHWCVELESGELRNFDAVIVATPVQAAANLLNDAVPELSKILATIQSASAAIVVGFIRRSQLPNRGADLKFGIVVPESLGRPIIACSFASNKFPGRCDEDEILVRCFFGGAMHPEMMDRSDQELEQLTQCEIADLLNAPKLKLNQARVVRWNQAMPQYQLGHLDRVDRIESIVGEIDRLAIAGNAYRGVGIPQCVCSGFEAARKIVIDLER